MPTPAEIRARLENVALEGWRWEHDAPGCVARLHENGMGKRMQAHFEEAREHDA